MPFVTTSDGTELFFNDWGSGRPVVLIHGWPLSSDMWEYQARPLAEAGLRVVAYDRRGFGKSSQPFSGYDYDTLSDDLAAVMGHLGLADAVLVGFSMGGGEVARYLSRHKGAGVGRAALVSAVTPFLLKTPDNPEGVDGGVFDAMTEALKKDRPGFLAAFGKTFYGVGPLTFSVSSDVLEWSQGLALKASPKATLACVDAFARTDFRADMAAFTVPTLIVHGSSDQTVPFAVSGKRAHAMIPSSELVVYDGAPHGLTYTERDRLTEDLLAFARG